MTRDLTTAELLAYQRDGVICVKNAVNQRWIDTLTTVVQRQLETPSTWVNDANPGASADRMFTDRYQWRTNANIRNYVFESGIGHLAAQAMNSNAARFYFDHILVKEPGTQAVTPWHQDLPYWPFKGQQICSIWLALTDTTVEESAMEFVRGSHTQEIYYLPEVFGDRNEHPTDWIRDGEGEPIPDIENHREDYDIIGWDMEAGDVVVFSAWLLHWAPGNASANRRRSAISTRWLGDDAVWHPHPGADPTVTQEHVSLAPGDLAHDDEMFPRVWPR